MLELRATLPHQIQKPGVSVIPFQSAYKLTMTYTELVPCKRSDWPATLPLPNPGTLTKAPGLTIAGLNPRSWVLFGTPESVSDVKVQTARLLDGLGLHTDLTYAWQFLRIDRELAKDLIAAFSPLDLTSFFKQAGCALTRFGDVRVLLVNSDPRAPITMMFDHSISGYIAGLFERPV